MELELGLQLLLQGLPAIAKIFTALHQERLRQLKRQQTTNIPKFSPQVAQSRLQENSEVQAWRFEQEKSLQQQLAAYNRETQLSLASYQRETALQLPECHKILDNWPLRLLPSQLLGSHPNQRIPLRIFIAPPQMQWARLGEVAQNLPEIEPNLAQSLGEFLSQNYPLNSPERPTEFLAGAWESTRFHREASIKTLFERLKSEPTLILESELVGEYLNFRIAYWGLGQERYCYQTILSRLNYQNILYASAKSRAFKWKETANRLLACGESPDVINRLGKDNCFNLDLLEKEEKWRRQGIDPSELALDYKVNHQDVEALSQLLITCHCLVAGWVADAHHLIHYDVSPLLPELLSSLLHKASDQQLVQAVMQTTIFGYKDIFKALETERPLWIPELALKLAQSLACLPDKTWAKEQLDYSLNAWLKQRQVPYFSRDLENLSPNLSPALEKALNSPPTLVGKGAGGLGIAWIFPDDVKSQGQVPEAEAANSLEATLSALTIEDQNYLETLKECLNTLGDDNAIAQVNTLLCTIEDLKGDRETGRGGEEEHSLTHTQDDQQTFTPAPSHTRTKSGCAITKASLTSGLRPAALSRKLLSASHPLSISEKLKPKPLLEKVSLIHTLTGHSGKAASIAVSFDGQTLASGGDDNSIKLWDLRTGELLQTLCGESGRVLTIALSPNGQILASSHKTSDKSCIKIWHLGTGELLCTLTGHNKWIYSLAISPDGKTLVSGGYKIKLWDLGSGEPRYTLAGHDKWIYSLAISPDGQTLVSSGGDKTVKIWQLGSDRQGASPMNLARSQESPLRTLTGHSDWVRTVAISPDGQILATGSDDNTIKLWELNTGKLIRTLTGHSDWVLSLAMTPDGQTLVSGSRDNTIKLWHLNTGKLLRTLTGHKKWVYSLAVTPDGHTLASGSEDKTIKIWQAV
jgi:WD40 repeat protein